MSSARTNEGGNGALNFVDTDIGERKLRLPRGRVAQTILLAIQITIANLRQLAIWQRDDKRDAPELTVLADASSERIAEPGVDQAPPAPPERPPRA